MMRALYTAATGMIAQQSNVDNISNNLSNVNTVGYKQEKMEFKSLLYQTIQTRTTSANGEEKPISAQVGLGTRVASNTSIYTQGSLMASENALILQSAVMDFLQCAEQTEKLIIPEPEILYGLSMQAVH